VIVNSNEEKNRKSNNEIMRKKTKEGPAKKETSKTCLQFALTKTRLFQNRTNERKKNKFKTNLDVNRCGCSSHVFPFMEISFAGFSSACLYPKYYKYV